MATGWRLQLQISYSLTKPQAEAESKEVSKRKHILPAFLILFPEVPKDPIPSISLIDQKNWVTCTPCSSLAKVTTSSMVAIEISWFSSWGQAHYLLNKISVLVAKKKRKRKKENGYSEVANRIYRRGFFTPGPLKAFLSECALLSSRERVNVRCYKLIWPWNPCHRASHETWFCGTYFVKHCPTLSLQYFSS